MTIKAIEREHVTKHWDGQETPVLLTAYKKKGAYKVSRGPNLVENEISLSTLDEVAEYAARGYLIRMRSEPMDVKGNRKRIEGLYAPANARIIR